MKKVKKSITICSSASFYSKVIEVKKELETMGFKVLVPIVALEMEKTKDFRVETYKTWFNNPNDYKRKTFLTKHHFDKVVKGDVTLVLNYEKNGKQGYIGGAVLSEMALAFYFKKPTYVLNPIDESSSFKEELYGLHPIILNGNLNLIKK